MSMLSMIKSAFGTLFFGGERTYHVFTKMKSRDAEIHLVQEDKHLRNAMWRYAINILLISLGISLFTAGLVFVSLYMLIVKPIINLSENMGNFSKNPENAALIFQPSGRADEIGTTERRLSVLQSELQATLRQKKHLADLGLAVSKINHDLRNILASAQLFTDRLVTIDDPTAQKFAPKLIRTIDRAVEYTREVLAYGKATESPPQLRVQRLHTLVEDVGDTLGFGQPDKDYKIEWINGVDHEHFVHADSEQLFRAILNISRNAVQVLENDSEQSAVKRLEISASFEGTTSLIRIKDTGPGISPHQQENLFSAFQGSTRPGGTGLGLAIAAELVRAHGGSIEIENSNSMGSVFLIKLPSHNG
ncbi:MAG: sensor histidine kinase, partial [Nitratireductor sp.]